MNKPLIPDELDKLVAAILARTIASNPRLADIIASELLKQTGNLTPDRISQTREHLYLRLGLSGERL